MALRSDMDVYARSCSVLTNFDVGATGGIKRRYGMRHVDEACEDYSRLFPYRYSEDLVYLIELSAAKLVVREGHGSFSVVAEFEGGNDSWSYGDLSRVNILQINSLLLFFSSSTPVMQLKLDEDNEWSFGEYEFAIPPWESLDTQDTAVTVEPNDTSGYYDLKFEGEDEDGEADEGDVLRLTFFTEREEAFETGASLRQGTWHTFSNTTPVSSARNFAVGDRIAVATDPVYECYVCTAEWIGTRDLCKGLSSPANYGDNFLLAEDLSGFDDLSPIVEFDESMTFKKGDKVRIKSGYWKLYTCVREFKGETDATKYTDPSQYPHYFIKGIPVGEALPCKGDWKFYCSGTWYGSYDVRRCYDSTKLLGDWASIAEAVSYIGSPQNTVLNGNEDSAECYLRLFLTSVRYKGSDFEAGFPSDSCANKLVVSSYQHDMILKKLVGELYEEGYRDVSAVPVALTSPLTTYDWSYNAFNVRYGYPAVGCLHEGRLVLAGTLNQPQTIWMSRSDDLNNFDKAESDDGSLLLTMNCPSQSVICWLLSRADCLMLGTEDDEWVIKSSSGGALTASSATLRNYGRNGSAHIAAICAADKVIYCERGSGRVYQYGYEYETDGYVSKDLTIYSDHIAVNAGGVVEGTVRKKPYAAIHFVANDGTMLCMTYNSQHRVNAWHRYVTEGKIESAACLSNGNDDDRLFLIVSRETERGAITRRVEVMDAESGYEDADGHDYESIMETTAFSVPDTNEKKYPISAVWGYVTTETPANQVFVRTAKSEYCPINAYGKLETGWARMISLSGWTDLPLVGVKACGNSPFNLLSVQV